MTAPIARSGSLPHRTIRAPLGPVLEKTPDKTPSLNPSLALSLDPRPSQARRGCRSPGSRIRPARRRSHPSRTPRVNRGMLPERPTGSSPGRNHRRVTGRVGRAAPVRARRVPAHRIRRNGWTGLAPESAAPAAPSRDRRAATPHPAARGDPSLGRSPRGDGRAAGGVRSTEDECCCPPARCTADPTLSDLRECTQPDADDNDRNSHPKAYQIVLI